MENQERFDDNPFYSPTCDYFYQYRGDEKDYAIGKMRKLGINVDEQMFEQCVNSLIFMLENSENFIKK